MTKLIKLSVFFDGYYGGYVDKYCLLPSNWNGVFIEELKIGETYEEKVYLGEIAGKHSECYGDLTVEEIDLETLSVKEIVDLINNADLGEFECYFEGREEDFEYYDDEEEAIEEKQRKLKEEYSISQNDSWIIFSSLISSNLIDSLKEIYNDSFVTISINKEDLELAKKVLSENGIDIY